MKTSKVLLFLTSLLLASPTFADVDQTLSELQKQWAQTQYQLEGRTQLKSYKALVEQAENATELYPAAAEIWVWRGIITSSFAGAKGGLGALSLASDAKEAFEKAIMFDGDVLSGSAYTSLATLYFKVPGWPISFGDDDEAQTLFKKSLTLNPDGIDSNYFYAEFLADQHLYEQAEHYLLKAENAAARPNRPVADNGRHKEIQLSLQNVRSKLKAK